MLTPPYETNPIGVILETSLTPEAFDAASGGRGHFWLQEHGVISTTTLLPTRLAQELGFRIFSFQWVDYEGEASIAFCGHIVSGPSDMVDVPISGILVRPVVPGKTILGFIYKDTVD